MIGEKIPPPMDKVFSKALELAAFAPLMPIVESLQRQDLQSALRLLANIDTEMPKTVLKKIFLQPSVEIAIEQAMNSMPPDLQAPFITLRELQKRLHAHSSPSGIMRIEMQIQDTLNSPLPAGMSRANMLPPLSRGNVDVNELTPVNLSTSESETSSHITVRSFGSDTTPTCPTNPLPGNDIGTLIADAVALFSSFQSKALEFESNNFTLPQHLLNISLVLQSDILLLIRANVPPLLEEAFDVAMENHDLLDTTGTRTLQKFEFDAALKTRSFEAVEGVEEEDKLKTTSESVQEPEEAQTFIAIVCKLLSTVDPTQFIGLLDNLRHALPPPGQTALEPFMVILVQACETRNSLRQCTDVPRDDVASTTAVQTQQHIRRPYSQFRYNNKVHPSVEAFDPNPEVMITMNAKPTEKGVLINPACVIFGTMASFGAVVLCLLVAMVQIPPPLDHIFVTAQMTAQNLIFELKNLNVKL